MANELVLRGVSKSFGGVQALKNVTLGFNAGEVHGIIGENGAGKSTFINILSGALTPTEGEIEFWGKTYPRFTPNQAIRLGIATVHQELTQFDAMTVADNILMSDYVGRSGFYDRKAQWERVEQLLADFQLDIRPDDLIGSLSTANREIVEIAKALNLDAKVIILDEPTAAMTVSEQKKLFGIIHRLKEKGMTIIYISHLLQEVEELCDRVSVLRDGNYVGTYPASELTINRMISLMVDRDLGSIYLDKEPCSDEVVLKVKHLTGNGVKDISFELHRGEILGLAGLAGAGRTELAQVLYGAARRQSGRVSLYGRDIDTRSTCQAIAQGIGLVPEDRKTQGVFLEKPIEWNITLVNIRQYCRSIFRSKGKERKAAEAYRERLRIKTPNLHLPAGSLSGGNQQKVAIAKMLSGNPDILIFDEPTKGVDIGAKKEIYQLMLDLTRQGKSILMISSDMGELLGVSERILVLHEGKIAGEVLKQDATQSRILELASGLG